MVLFQYVWFSGDKKYQVNANVSSTYELFQVRTGTVDLFYPRPVKF